MSNIPNKAAEEIYKAKRFGPKCPNCQGRGFMGGQMCRSCSGNGCQIIEPTIADIAAIIEKHYEPVVEKMNSIVNDFADNLEPSEAGLLWVATRLRTALAELEKK